MYKPRQKGNKTMKVNVNGLRSRMAESLSDLINKLDRSIDSSGYVYVASRDIKNELDELRQTICLFCHMYEDNDELFVEMPELAANIPRFTEGAVDDLEQ